MGPKTPPTIRKEVIRGLLTGLTRDEIAKRNSIGAGTVSAIINECREVDPHFDLLRELAISLRRDSLSVGDFASIVRLRALFIEWGLLDDSRIEEFIEKVNIYCFRVGILPENFVDLVHKVISMADQLETSVDRLPSEIQRKQEKLKRLQHGVKLIGKLMEHLHARYKVTKKDIDDYRTNKPLLVGENTRLRTENEILKQENSALRKENSQQYMKLYKYSYSEMISENELKKLDQIWLPNEGKMSVTELHEIAHEIYRNPVKYINIIRLIRKNRAQKAAA